MLADNPLGGRYKHVHVGSTLAIHGERSPLPLVRFSKPQTAGRRRSSP